MDLLGVLLQWRSASAARHRFASPVLAKALHPPDGGTDADVELFSRFTAASSGYGSRGVPQLMADLIGGQVQVSFEPLSNPIEHIRTGRLRALAVTAASRSVLLPDIPTVGEFMAGYEASGWQGIAAPKNTPAEIVTALNQEINAGLADAEMKARFINRAATSRPLCVPKT